MDKEFQTSFIPKKPLSEERVEREQQPIGLVLLLAIILLVASVVFAGGMYLYRSYISKQIASMEASLRLAEGEFERGVVEELELLERRLGAAQTILSTHISVSPIFALLEQETLPTVRFTDFQSGAKEETGDPFSISMKGEATSYTQIALQSDLLSRNKELRNIIFSNLTLGERGTVLFDLKFSVDPAFVLYEQVVAQSIQALENETEEEDAFVSSTEEVVPTQQAPNQQAPSIVPIE